jgi:hypothetical protein
VQVNSYQPTTNELDLKGANGLSSQICLKRGKETTFETFSLVVNSINEKVE